jgi:predicted nucleic acid-binding protein
VILLDTTVLVYAAGAEHPLREPCRRLMRAHREGGIHAATTGEVVQEFIHVYGRRRPRSAAAELARRYLAALPLLSPTRAEIEIGVDICERHEAVGAFGAVLAGVTLGRNLQALISADRAFGTIMGLNWVSPGGAEFEALLAGPGA